MSSKTNNVVAENEGTFFSNGRNFVDYFKLFWSFQRGEIELWELISYGTEGLHIFRTLHNPDGKNVTNGQVKDTFVSHPIEKLSEQESIDLTGHGLRTGKVTATQKASVKLHKSAERYEALEALLNVWDNPNNRANSKNTWVRYWLVCHAHVLGMIGDGILGTTYRNMVGLTDNNKFNFVMSRVLGSDPEAIRKEWDKAQAEKTKQAKTKEAAEAAA